MSNRVVSRPTWPADVSADDVLAFTEKVFAGRGLTHSKIDVLDDELGMRLTPGLVAEGYEPAPVLIMVAVTTPGRTSGVIVVEAVDEAEMAGLVERGWSSRLPTSPPRPCASSSVAASLRTGRATSPGSRCATPPPATWLPRPT